MVVAAALLAALGSAPAHAAAPKPVPSLTPKATQKLWQRLVHERHPRVATLGCRAARVVFYAQTDWLRLATKLAANPSPCAEYYVSVPPLAADKTAMRSDQAWRIRALGPQFHALAEVHFAGWSNWVSTTGSTWYAAGQEARRRMAAAGFDVAAGDGWALNELSSAVRRGDGSARQNVRDFLHGLYDGDGTVPVAKGVAFANGIAQSTSDLSLYKTNLQNWLQDSAFWSDMSAYVSDWSQEVYGDVRDYAVAGADVATRTAANEAWLDHEASLANAGPDAAATARAFLASASAPLANAAWAWDSAYGWTAVPVATMQDYVSAQVYALRAFDASTGATVDRLGFAWAPKNLTGMTSTDYTTQTASVLDRLAAAIADSGSDPAAACGAEWCTASVDGAAFNNGWSAFSAWTPMTLAFATPAATLTAGSASGALTVQLGVGGVAQAASEPTSVTLASSSPAGAFASDPAGPWSPTLTLTIPAGSASASFYYEDTAAGTPTLTATSSFGSSAQAETVTAAAPASLTLTPASSTVPVGGSATFTASGADAYGNAVAPSVTWTLASGTPGSLSATTATTATFTGSAAGSGGVVATSGSVTATAPVTVTAPGVRVGSVAERVSSKRLYVTVTTVRADGTGAVAGAAVSISIYRNGGLWTTARGTTSSTGAVTFVSSSRVGGGCYTTKVTAVTLAPYQWDGATPANSLCI